MKTKQTGVIGGIGRKRNIEEKEQDLQKAMELYLKGYNYREIAEMVCAGKEYKLSSQTMLVDIAKCIDGWAKSRQKMLDKHLEIELARIDQMRKAYWDGWQRSLTARTKEKVKQGGRVEAPTHVYQETETEERIGDPAWLDGLKWCTEMTCKLLGLLRVGKDGPAFESESTKPAVREIIFLTKTRPISDSNISDIEVIETKALSHNIKA